jgi:hypothetical protein
MLDERITALEEIDEVKWVDQLPITDGFGTEIDPSMRSQWIFKHNVVEVCTAVKGQMMLEILQREDCEGAFYLDPDIVVLDSLELLLGYLRNAGSILLTPHITGPQSTEDTVLDNEFGPLKWGIFNLGFLGVRKDENGLKFARWWRDRLMLHCYDDISNGVFTDQSWCDLVPAFFEGCKIVREPEFNVATWNLSDRHVTGDDIDNMIVNGERKLAFFHFSGIDRGAQLIMLNKYGSHMPVLYELRNWYLDKCKEYQEDFPISSEWAYDVFDDGTKITHKMRVLYRTRRDLQQAFPDPFKTGPNSYLEWFRAERKKIHLTQPEYMSKSMFMQKVYKYYRKIRKN